MAILEKYSEYVTEWVRHTEDNVIMFDDLQPTDEGRFTGRDLLKRIWNRRQDTEGV
jgi:hypothetical protein